jgi:putative NADH-flavin reductase
MKQNQKIAVIGATGKAGRYLVKHLLEQGYSIKVLVRNPDKFSTTSPLAEVIKGDVRNYTDVYTLLENCDAVISTLGQSKGEAPIFSQATGHVIQAMHAQHIMRYIVVTGLSIDAPYDRKSFRTRLSSRIMKWIFPAIIADKQKELSMLQASDVDWTMVRLPFIEQTEEAENPIVDLHDCPGKKISASALAKFLVQQLSDQRYLRKSPFIASK